MSKLLLAACCQHLFRMPKRDQALDATTKPHGLAASNGSASNPVGQSTGAKGKRHRQGKAKAQMAPMVEEQDQEEAELEPDFQNYGNRQHGSATYIWPRLGASAEDNINEHGAVPEEDDSEDSRIAREDGSLSYMARELNVSEELWRRFVLSEARGLDWAWAKMLKKPKAPSTEPSAHGLPDGGTDLEKGIDGRPLPHRKQATPSNIYWTLDPFAPLSLRWRMFMTVFDGLYSAFYLPISVGWHEWLTVFTWFNVLDYLGAAVYAADIVMNFITGFVAVNNMKRHVLRRPDLIARYYMFHSTFFVDMATFLPVTAEIVEMAYPGHGGNTVARCIILARLFRLVRVFKLAQWLIFLSLVGQFSKSLLRFMNVGTLFLVVVTYAALVLINLLACIWFFVATLEGLPNSWLASVGSGMKDWSGQAGPKQWVAAVYFITVSLTSIGYGDISARTPAEMLVSVAINLLGIVFLGFVIATSQELIKQVNDEARRVAILRTKMQAVEIWNFRRHLSTQLRKQIRTYFAEVWLDHQELQDDQVFGELPAILKTAVAHELTDSLMEQSHIFGPLRPEARRVVASRLQPVSLPAGHDLCKQGDKADCLWILQHGELLSMHSHQGMELVHAPAILGEAAVLAEAMSECAERQSTLRAATHTALWRLDVHDIRHVAETFPELKRRLMDAFREHLLAEAEENPDIKQDPLWRRVLDSVTSQGRAAERAEEEAESSEAWTETRQAEAAGALPHASAAGIRHAKKYAKHWRSKATGIGTEQDDIPQQGHAADKIFDTLVQANQRKYGGMRRRAGGLIERG